MIDVVSKPSQGPVILKLRNGTLVGHLAAMHPSGECMSIRLLVAGSSRMDIIERARRLGIPGVEFDDMDALTDAEAQSVLGEQDRVLWRRWPEGPWLPLSEMARHA